MIDRQRLAGTGLIERASALASRRSPVIIGIDGRSGVGKSTLAGALAEALGAQVVDGDAFFAGGVGLHQGTAEARADACIDRQKLRAVLAELRAGRAATYRPFDWDAFDGRLQTSPATVPVAPLYLLEGVYACHPDLHGRLDLKVLAHVAPEVRMTRLLAREGSIGPWETQWHEAEDWYFSALMPPDRFDVAVDLSDGSGPADAI